MGRKALWSAYHWKLVKWRKPRPPADADHRHAAPTSRSPPIELVPSMAMVWTARLVSPRQPGENMRHGSQSPHNPTWVPLPRTTSAQVPPTRWMRLFWRALHRLSVRLLPRSQAGLNVARCLQLLEILEISWNFIDAPGKFNCQLKYANMPVTEPNLVTSLNLINCYCLRLDG